jgi:hypothetical protein
MQRAWITLLASAAAVVGFSTPAIASVTLSSVNGPNLTTFIKASTTNSQNDNVVVYGSTLNSGQSADVTFTGNTAVHITDGAGFAAISDVLSDNTLFTAITSDPVPNFNAYQFSIQLNNDTFVLVQYQVSGSSTWFNALMGDTTNPFAQAANTLMDYQITANAGEVLSAIRISTCLTAAASSCNQTGTGAGTGGSIFLFKQNSINEVTPVPEPATWGLMLLGFAGLGMAMRRSQRRGTALMQVA